jgi:predicted nucleic acid-binding protein
MRILFDTNIILDVLLDREPFVKNALYLFAKVERSDIDGFICATTVTTIYYLLHKALGRRKAERHIKTLLSLFQIAPVNRFVIEDALNLNFHDFEDAVLYISALTVKADCIVTRNCSDFKRAKLDIYAPDELVKIMKRQNLLVQG